jgi:hypothetical protein
MSTYERLMKVVNATRRVKQLPELVAQRAAPKIADLVESEYANGQDPYGVPWAPLAPATLKTHGPPPLTDSGAMRTGTNVVSAGPQIIATAPDPAGYHQSGTGRMPARPILPNDADGIPQSWERALAQAEIEIESEIQAQINSA